MLDVDTQLVILINGGFETCSVMFTNKYCATTIVCMCLFEALMILSRTVLMHGSDRAASCRQKSMQAIASMMCHNARRTYDLFPLVAAQVAQQIQAYVVFLSYSEISFFCNLAESVSWI